VQAGPFRAFDRPTMRRLELLQALGQAMTLRSRTPPSETPCRAFAARKSLQISMMMDDPAARQHGRETHSA